jgi:hypothetical protein
MPGTPKTSTPNLQQVATKKHAHGDKATNYPLIEGSVAEQASESLRQYFPATSIDLQSQVKHALSRLTIMILLAIHESECTGREKTCMDCSEQRMS